MTPREILHLHTADNFHAHHVHVLALSLFDEVKQILDLSETDRKIIAAAALLHDIGFKTKPDNHARESARILAKTSISGFSASQQAYIAAVVYLHQQNYKAALKTKPLKLIKNRKRAMRLAALLRIADGLDHSHFQDCELLTVTVTPHDVLLTVRSRWYAGNAARAMSRADLWQDIFGHQVRIVDQGADRPCRYSGVVVQGATCMEGFRTLLSSQHRCYLDTFKGAYKGTDPEYLHDMRVALRRARMIFVFFRPVISRLDCAAHEITIKRLTSRLGPFRDSHVWIEFLASLIAEQSLHKHKAWKLFLKQQQNEDSARHPDLQALLNDNDALDSMKALALFLRCSLPAAVSTQQSEPMAPFAADRLHHMLTKLLQHRLLKETDDPEFAHGVRKTVRKARYYAEITESVLPQIVHPLTIRLKAVSDAMGTLHDIDVHLERLSHIQKHPPHITSITRKKRKQAFAAYRESWHSLTDDAFMSNVRKTLKEETCATGTSRTRTAETN